jgi:hypothetical protein
MIAIAVLKGTTQDTHDVVVRLLALARLKQSPNTQAAFEPRTPQSVSATARDQRLRSFPGVLTPAPPTRRGCDSRGKLIRLCLRELASLHTFLALGFVHQMQV